MGPKNARGSLLLRTVIFIVIIGCVLWISWRTKENGESLGRRQLRASSRFTDPKTVTPRPPDPLSSEAQRRNDESALQIASSYAAGREDGGGIAPFDEASRRRCQIVYVMGVEGAAHHGFVPVLEYLAQVQSDPDTGLPFSVDSESKPLKAGLFGWYGARYKRWGFRIGKNLPPLDDPALVRAVVRDACPDDGRRHVLIEWASFPAGQADDHRSYRVHRQREWADMTPQQIADTDEAMGQPANMTAFVEAYSPHAEIKFVVLHRPFLETITSHGEWDGGPEAHSNIIRGFMLLLRRFLDAHVLDPIEGTRMWTMVCVEMLMVKNHNVLDARRNMVADLARFLGWPEHECPLCFRSWRDSRKDPLKYLGPKGVELLREHMLMLEGVWPPSLDDEGAGKNQCRP